MTHPKNNEYSKKWREAHPEQYKAKNKVTSAKTYQWKKVTQELGNIDKYIFLY